MAIGCGSAITVCFQCVAGSRGPACVRLRECVGMHVCGKGLGEAGARHRYAHDAHACLLSVRFSVLHLTLQTCRETLSRWRQGPADSPPQTNTMAVPKSVIVIAPLSHARGENRELYRVVSDQVEVARAQPSQISLPDCFLGCEHCRRIHDLNLRLCAHVLSSERSCPRVVESKCLR